MCKELTLYPLILALVLTWPFKRELASVLKLMKEALKKVGIIMTFLDLFCSAFLLPRAVILHYFSKGGIPKYGTSIILFS